MGKAVLGGGIAGLTAAYYLRKKFPRGVITLIEGSSRVGGWIKSSTCNGALFEQGPRTIRPVGYKGANTLKLIEDLNLQPEILTLSKNDAAVKNRMIYVNGKLHTLPSSFSSLFKKQSPFSKPLIYYLLQENSLSNKIIPEQDEPIYNFVERRFGKEIADYAISPLMCGICGGDSHKISVKFLMEELFKYEQEYGSVTYGILRNLFKTSSKPKSVQSHLNNCAKRDKWSIYTFTEGLETLPKRLQEVNMYQDVDFLLNCSCTAIEITNEVTIHTNNSTINADHLLACIPAHTLQILLKGHPKLSLLLQNIPFVSIGVVNLQYKCNVLGKEAFGFLVPPKERLPILGVTFDSCCYPCGGGTVLTVMMGGEWFNQHFGHNPTKQHLLDVALQQVGNILGITQMPDGCLVNIHKNCIPQYVVGHNDLIKKISDYIKDRKLPLSLCGASYNGIGINDVIWCSKTAVDNLE